MGQVNSPRGTCQITQAEIGQTGLSRLELEGRLDSAFV